MSCQNKHECVWKQVSKDNVPDDAVQAGWDENETIYVGRAHHEHEIIPGKIVPSHEGCYVSHSGEEVKKCTYEVLCNPHKCSLEWVEASNGDVPDGAVEGGKTEYNESLYIGRAAHKDLKICGKIQRSHKCLYIPFGGGEIKYPQYEVLVCKSTPENK